MEEVVSLISLWGSDLVILGTLSCLEDSIVNRDELKLLPEVFFEPADVLLNEL